MPALISASTPMAKLTSLAASASASSIALPTKPTFEVSACRCATSAAFWVALSSAKLSLMPSASAMCPATPAASPETTPRRKRISCRSKTAAPADAVITSPTLNNASRLLSTTRQSTLKPAAVALSAQIKSVTCNVMFLASKTFGLPTNTSLPSIVALTAAVDEVSKSLAGLSFSSRRSAAAMNALASGCSLSLSTAAAIASARSSSRMVAVSANLIAVSVRRFWLSTPDLLMSSMSSFAARSKPCQRRITMPVVAARTAA